MLRQEALPVLVFASMFLPGCGHTESKQTAIPAQSPIPPAISAPPRSDGIAMLKDIYNPATLPEEYSSFIRDNSLIPTELKSSPKENIAMGVNYLRRFRDALQNEDYKGPTFSSLNINKANYPIAIPDNWTIWHLADSFLDEVKKGKVELGYYQDPLTTAQDIFERTGNKINRTKTIISIGNDLLENRSDSKLAASLLSEYAQTLQKEEIIKLYVPPNTMEIYALIAEKGGYAEGIPREAAIKRGLPFEMAVVTRCSEAQRKAIEFLFLHNLYLFNDSSRFLGSGYEEKLFQKTVIRSADALSPAWLIHFSK